MNDTESIAWLDQEQQQIWRTYLLGVARINQRLDDDLREFGIDLAEYEILVCLEEVPEHRLRMSELADAVHQSRSRLTHTIARMERAGLVERVNCPTDRRGVWAQITDSGLELLRRAAPVHVAGVRRNFVEVADPEDFRAIGRTFAKVLEVE
ncbi:MarR family winged helix-turn-helix transcriptional regulator [Granulicoccus phenolivorans]|uniref:MarR family winged helix-turn-helix transcriptional regulator n=1 Tax=Granulicoccus phenolivorans TaxID=266854 RepID=UPI000413F87A|nr:MarR family transcriptional regulator [Granulicoccus phenolivorans]